MIKYLFDPPGVIKNIYTDFVWESFSANLLLSFDDGPTIDSTEVILKYLNEKRIKSIFFCVGNNIKNNPSLIEEILSEGHQIGNHTYNHRIISKLSHKEAVSELTQTNSIMLEKFNYPIKYFRPPHGRFNKNSCKIIQQTGLKNVMWSLMTFDYKNEIKIVKFAVQRYLKKNSIIVFHDSKKSKSIILDSLKITIDTAEEKGYRFGDVNQCLK